jgi:hypothetical protein
MCWVVLSAWKLGTLHYESAKMIPEVIILILVSYTEAVSQPLDREVLMIRRHYKHLKGYSSCIT